MQSEIGDQVLDWVIIGFEKDNYFILKHIRNNTVTVMGKHNIQDLCTEK
jgi:hypothetical protein